jgi:hypothetical protein
LLVYGLEYAGFGLQAFICFLLARQGRWRRLKGPSLYMAGLLLLDGVGRSAVQNYFGVLSAQYAYFYWLTDFLFAMGAFLLTCGFFRRATVSEERIWSTVRLVLIFVFIVVLGISSLSLTRNYSHLYTGGQVSVFIVEFSQNLYFSCLILNTLLYVMIQQLAIDDDELALLVCGMGVQFAGEAAGLALYHLGLGAKMPFVSFLFSLLNPACTLGMLLTWIYAIKKRPETVPVRSQLGKQAVLAEAFLD